MSIKPGHHYLDKKKTHYTIITHLKGSDEIYVSMVNEKDQNHIVYYCDKEDLRGLADFIYETIGEKK